MSASPCSLMVQHAIGRGETGKLVETQCAIEGFGSTWGGGGGKFFFFFSPAGPAGRPKVPGFKVASAY